MQLPLPTCLKFSSEAEACDLHLQSTVPWQRKQFGDLRQPLTVPNLIAGVGLKPPCDEQLTREAVLLTFCNPLPQQCSRLQRLSKKEWQSLLHWLDISGLALYFLDRMVELKLCDWLPFAVFARLQQNLMDNTERTHGMIAESTAIQHEFQQAHLSYANLKGLSLWPSSVPKPELRSQFDLDFLVAEESALEARRILEHRGYRLYVVSGRSWEFKLNERPGISLKDIYRESTFHAVELHIESNVPGRPSLLRRVEWRELYGLNMPVLSSVDLFLGQGLHVYKHLCSEFLRTAHLLEFRRHVLTRRDDPSFWEKLRSMSEENPRDSLELGVITLLLSRVMGEFAPKGLSSWTVLRLPQSVQLWVEMYGRRTAFGNFPGSKLYLLLQAELEAAGVTAKRSPRQALLPLRLPPLIIQAFPNEPLSVQLGRYRMQLNFIFLRLRFHLVEGIRYRWESLRWQHFLNRLTR